MTEPKLHAEGAVQLRRGGHWPFLDLLRFGAALLVLFGHTRGLLFTSFQDIAHPGLGTKVFYFLTGIHREGVAIFFAVSGFLVGGAVWRAIRGQRFDPKAYLASRFARIYLVLVPALALALLLDWAGRSFLGDTRFFGERPLMPMGFTSDWTWPQMACNVAAVQGIFCKPLGVNPPLWSLGYEWVFYLIAPILFGLALVRFPRPARVGGIALVLAGIGALAGPLSHWLPWLVIWLAGALAAQIVRARELPLWSGLLGLAVVAAGFVLSRTQSVPVYATDLMVGLGTALAIANGRLLGWCPLRKPVRIGADFSYSLYLIHVPVTVLLGGIIEHFGWHSTLVVPSAPVYAAFAGLVISALVAAFLFAQVTERHTDRVRRFFLERSSLKASAPPTPV
ncbi:acyltransferase family protein [Microvirga lotononidis]|uniref:Putative acyltransferase n=1 Tax=Microvirga lotononidis TaxID=864069 RepID=I4YL85_9HYPH|nr:acyltransferase [Microvirga lotononidis]EIM24727.1 putative acyltransferase [Microvirga lotononidis]WQO26734.1 acyltransferase [Microvirga lotononidis]